MGAPVFFKVIHEFVHGGYPQGDLLVEKFHCLMETGTQEKLDPLRGRGRTPLDVAELELGGAGKEGVDAGVRINRHGLIINNPDVKTALFTQNFN